MQVPTTLETQPPQKKTGMQATLPPPPKKGMQAAHLVQVHPSLVCHGAQVSKLIHELAAPLEHPLQQHARRRGEACAAQGSVRGAQELQGQRVLDRTAWAHVF